MKHLILLLLLVSAPAFAADAWNPRQFGAKADGQTLDTKAIQAAIDACAKAGGGTVNLAGGVFLSGTIRLRSNVALFIDHGATLRGSADIKDYEDIIPQINFLYRGRFSKSLIFAEREENIALLGTGTIDGQGKLFPGEEGDGDVRPYLIRFSECRNARVRDLTMRDAARWLSHYLACENVTIDGVTIHSRIRANRDGMDIDSCDRVRISNCDIFTGDDSIVLKSTAGRPSRRITVTNCTLSSNASALKMGTESQGGFEDVTFSNCVVYDTRDGVSIEMVDGGACERINVSNIVMRDVAIPIFVRLGNRANPLPGQPVPGMGSMRDIMITNIQASGASVTGCSITGVAGHPAENITLENIRIRFAGGGTAADAATKVPAKVKSYPKGPMFGTLPAYGFYARHVKGLRLHNLDLGFDKDDVRPALVADDVSELDVLGLRAQVAATAEAMIRLQNVRGALFHGCQWTGQAGTFLSVAGAQSRDIALRNNHLPANPVATSPDLPAGAVSLDANAAP